MAQSYLAPVSLEGMFWQLSVLCGCCEAQPTILHSWAAAASGE